MPRLGYSPDGSAFVPGRLSVSAVSTDRGATTVPRSPRDRQPPIVPTSTAAPMSAPDGKLPFLWLSISPHSTPRSAKPCLTTDGPLLVLAGAGSGKTRVLTYRIAHLIGDLRVSPAEILAITFTNKAAAEMRERLGALVGPGVRSMWVMTFHAMCVRMLRADAELLGFTRNFTIYDADDSKRMLKDVMRELEIDEKHYPVNGVANRISSAKNELLTPAEFAAKAVSPLDKKAAQVYARYQQRLLAANAMDFDDLLVNAYRLLAEHPARARAYQDRFRYISVDEYQDTNHAQYRSRTCSRPGTATSWSSATTTSRSTRGAAPTSATSSSSSATIRRPTVVKLEQNYRSTRAHPRRRQRRGRQQPQPQAQDAVHRQRRGREDRELPRERRARRGPLHRRRDRAARCAPSTAATPTSRSSTAPTPSRACSRTRSCAPACRTASSAARASSTAPRSATSMALPQGRREPRRRDQPQAHHQHAQAQASATPRSSASTSEARASATSRFEDALRLAVEDDRHRRARASRSPASSSCSTSCARCRATCAISSRWSSRAPG